MEHLQHPPRLRPLKILSNSRIFSVIKVMDRSDQSRNVLLQIMLRPRVDPASIVARVQPCLPDLCAVKDYWVSREGMLSSALINGLFIREVIPDANRNNWFFFPLNLLSKTFRSA